ncbi:hypothetical protein [Pedobacter sp. ASV12]|uniref:hypothetical protein n=1 Tax=Pedobacter sp. ASV12 TaxID=2795120 RepID=UPI0018EB34EA|nr:hypothetical protein [Pedobacter sp. ASV12]
MKKVFFILLLASSAMVVQAQMSKAKNGNTNNQQSSASSTAVNDADYFLAVAKVTIKTGKDNKELNSKLIVRVYPTSGTDNYQKGYMMENYMPELKVWSTKEFYLPRAPGFDQAFNSLAHYRQTGVMVDILYNTQGNGPFFGLDAWKIDEVNVVLEFKDKNGNPHPTMPSKTIYFTGSDMYLDFMKWHLFCKTDAYFNTLPTFITKRE